MIIDSSYALTSFVLENDHATRGCYEQFLGASAIQCISTSCDPEAYLELDRILHCRGQLKFINTDFIRPRSDSDRQPDSGTHELFPRVRKEDH